MKNFKTLLLMVLLSTCYLSTFADIIPINISHATTTAFADEIEGDGKGGWIDAGSHDMRLLPTGKLKINEIPFIILDDATTNGKSCIVLNDGKRIQHLPKAVKLRLPENIRGENLYLLQAGAWMIKKDRVVGELSAEYADGSKTEFKVLLHLM